VSFYGECSKRRVSDSEVVSLNRNISWTLFIVMETQRVGMVLSCVVRNLYKPGLYISVMSDTVSELLCFYDVNMVIDGA